ncbi:MAG: [Ni/Fe] hydrogenase small subunit, partial [Bacteroidia bacterium]|nr:[Ni/Fe] hydrogenase small subunit [Bacteroidia bacterium]
SENNFWDNGPFYERITKFPGFGIESNADKVGMVATGAVGAGIAVHAVAANLSKKRQVKKRVERGISNEERLEK